jgi:bifunctional N-acetylglutamate synthase/kinase
VESRKVSTSASRLQLQLQASATPFLPSPLPPLPPCSPSAPSAALPRGTQTPTRKRATPEPLPGASGLLHTTAPFHSNLASMVASASAAAVPAPAPSSPSSPSKPSPPTERTLITQLLSRFKQTAEVRQYLKHYGRVDSDRFAVIKLSGDVLNSEEETARVASSLAFLHRIGLVPIVVHGAGLFTGRRAAPVPDSSSSAVSPQQVMEAAVEHMVTSNARLVEALRREGIDALPLVEGVFGADPDPDYEGELAGSVGRITAVDVEAITSAVGAGKIPVVAAMGSPIADELEALSPAASSSSSSFPLPAPFTFPTHEAAIALAKMVQPLKVIWLRPEGGLRTAGGEVIRSVDLARDAPQLVGEGGGALAGGLFGLGSAASSGEHVDFSAEMLDSASSATEAAEAERAAKVEACVEELALSPADASSLVELASFHEVLREPGATVSVTTPEFLAEELFTHKGAGTLITRGERVYVHSSLETVDLPRLYALIGKAFAMPLPEGYIEGLFASGRLKRVYITEEYRGAAVVLHAEGMTSAAGAEGAAAGPASSSGGVSYLDKFAVDPSAQGDKLGEVLWKAMVQRERKLFWRSRTSNRVNPWYYEQSDGCYKASGTSRRDGAPTGQWTVFWRNMGDDEVMKAVDIALALPATFPPRAYGDPRLHGGDGAGDGGGPPGLPTLK